MRWGVLFLRLWAARVHEAWASALERAVRLGPRLCAREVSGVSVLRVVGSVMCGLWRLPVQAARASAPRGSRVAWVLFAGCAACDCQPAHGMRAPEFCGVASCNRRVSV
jgi:hypothetical protein